MLAGLLVVSYIVGSAETVIVARIASYIAFTGIAILLVSRNDRRCLLNPALLLSFQAIVLYSAAIWISTVVGEPNWVVKAQQNFLFNYFDGASEILVLGTGVMFLAFAILPLYAREYPKAFPIAGTANMRLLWVVSIIGALSVAAFYILETRHPAIIEFAATRAGSEIHNAAAPVMAFCLAAGVFACSILGRFSLVTTVIAVGFCLWAMMQAIQAPVPIILLLALTSLWISTNTVSIRAIAATCVGLAIALGLIVTIKTHLINTNNPLTPNVSVRQTIIAKFVERQMASAGCLDQIVERAGRYDAPGNPFYFLAGPVPRVLWPDKPNLSRGAEFAEDCGMSGSRARGHSESITILGEPLIEAGISGLLAAFATLAVLLTLAWRLVVSQTAVGPILVAASFPWLCAFQQHFALYFANILKMVVIVSPLIIALMIWQRYSRPVRDEAP